jgi:hypothetical protein
VKQTFSMNNSVSLNTRGVRTEYTKKLNLLNTMTCSKRKSDYTKEFIELSDTRVSYPKISQLKELEGVL